MKTFLLTIISRGGLEEPTEQDIKDILTEKIDEDFYNMEFFIKEIK